MTAGNLLKVEVRLEILGPASSRPEACTVLNRNLFLIVTSPPE